MAEKVLNVVLMVVGTALAVGLSFLFTGIISFAFRHGAVWLFLACCVGILALDALWMRRVFGRKPLPQAR